MRALLLAGGVLVVSALITSAPAQDAAAGRKIATSICQTCHGLNGIAKMADVAAHYSSLQVTVAAPPGP